MTRILWVSHAGIVAGGERSMLAAIEHRPDGVETLLACPPGPLVERAAAFGTPHRELPPIDLSFRPHPVETPQGLAAVVRAGIALRRIVRRDRIDVIIANTARASLAALLVPQRVPVIGYAREILPNGLPGKIAHAPMTSCAAAVIANSRATAATLPRGRAPVHVVHNALDRGPYEAAAALSRDQARRRLAIPEGVTVFAVIGYLAPLKGQDDAIRALAATSTGHPWQLLLVGEAMFPKGRADTSSYAAGLPGLARELGVSDRVRLLGQRDDVAEVLRAVDVVLVPSWRESFSRTVIEGMWSGCVVIATNVGGPAELIDDGVDGVLLPPREPQRWAAAIAGLLDDPERVVRLAGAGGEKVRGAFDPVDYGARIAEIARRTVDPSAEPLR